VGRLEAWRAAGARVAAKLFLRRGLGGSVPTLRARLERRGIPLLVSAWWSRLGGSGRAFPAAGPDEAGPHVPCPRPVDRGPADAPCQAGRRRAFVDRHLRLRPCHVSSHVAADLSDTPLREAWEDDRRWGAWRSGTLSDLPSCLECDVQRFCHVCPAPVFDGRGTSACSDPALAWARHGASRADGRAAAGD